MSHSKKARAKPSKKAKTKQIKKTTTAKRPTPQGVMAVVPYDQIVKPEMHRGKMSLIPTRFTPVQLNAIVAPVPQNIIKKRPGKGGGEWSYVPGWWFKKKANFVFGFMHSFTVLKTEVIGDFITVTGRVTIRDPKTGNVLIEKDDFGGAAIKYLRGSKIPLDIGNDFKAAQTDAFKRCMVQFGFAMNVYGVDEMRDNDIIVDNHKTTEATVGVTRVVSGKKAEVKFAGPEHECQECANPMTKAEVDYSKKFFKGKQLCRSCQGYYKKNNL